MKRAMTKQEEQVYSALLQEFRDKLPSQSHPWFKVSGNDLSMVCMYAIAAVSLHKIPVGKMYERATEELRQEWGRPDANFYVGPRVFARVYNRAKELLNP